MATPGAQITGQDLTGSQPSQHVTLYEQTGEAPAIGRVRTLTAKRKNEELFPIEISVTTIATDDEVEYGVFIRDISDKVRLQEQLIESERLAAIRARSSQLTVGRSFIPANLGRERRFA